jgi:hypothetical protein
LRPEEHGHLYVTATEVRAYGTAPPGQLPKAFTHLSLVNAAISLDHGAGEITWNR